MNKKIDEIKRLMEEEKVNSNITSLLVEIFNEMENQISSLSQRCEELEEEIEALNEDVSLLNDGMHIEEYDTVFSAVCPYCHEEIEINIEELDKDDDEFTCPHCKKEISLEWDDECGCCDCDHDHDCGDDCDCGEHDDK